MYVSRTNFIQSEYRAGARRVFVSRPAFINRTHLHSAPDAGSACGRRIIFPIRYKYKRRIFGGNTEYEIGRVSSAEIRSIRRAISLAWKRANFWWLGSLSRDVTRARKKEFRGVVERSAVKWDARIASARLTPCVKIIFTSTSETCIRT